MTNPEVVVESNFQSLRLKIAHISTPLWLQLLILAHPCGCFMWPTRRWWFLVFSSLFLLAPYLVRTLYLENFAKKQKKKSDRRVNYMRVHRLTRMKFLRHLCSPAWLLVSARGGCLVSAQSGASMGTMVVQFIPGRILRVRSSPGDHGDPVRILRVRFSHGDHGDPARILRV